MGLQADAATFSDAAEEFLSRSRRHLRQPAMVSKKMQLNLGMLLRHDTHLLQGPSVRPDPGVSRATRSVFGPGACMFGVVPTLDVENVCVCCRCSSPCWSRCTEQHLYAACVYAQQQARRAQRATHGEDLEPDSRC